MTVSVPTPPDRERTATRFEWLWWILLLVLVTLLWCAAYNRWTVETWQTPVDYGGDAWAEMGTAKVFASGEVIPFFPRFPSSLGAPFHANWNDYPLVEQAMFFWWGLLIRCFGILLGSNLAVLSAHLFAAASFYFVCREFRYHRAFSIAGAALFAMSHYAFSRSLPHLILTFYWHIPLAVLVLSWCLQPPQLAGSVRKIVISVAVALAFAIQNPYYTGLFLQFLVGASLICFLRREKPKRALFPLFLFAVVLIGFFIVNAATLYIRIKHGGNSEAVTRDYAGVERYALKPVELLLPFPHRWPLLHQWASTKYFTQAAILGEIGSGYLGLVAIAGLGLLGWTWVRTAIRADSTTTPPYVWPILWIFMFSVIGGLNGLLAVFGLTPFRATNRYSIFILAFVLLFVVERLSAWTRRWPGWSTSVLAGGILFFGFWDQSPPPPRTAAIEQMRNQVLSDRSVASTLEGRLGPHAMVFQLPATPFPEVGPVLGMTDYEHLRLFFYSKTLRFSYGSHKGRPRERWQTEAQQLGAEHLVATLEQYGFSAIMINRKAYADGATALLATLESAGRAEKIAESTDLVCISLHPSSNPGLPPEFNDRWYGLEGTRNENWRWSKGDATIILHNEGKAPKRARCTFGLGSLRSSQLSVSSRSEALYSGPIEPGQPPAPVSFEVALAPGPNEIRFRTTTPAELPGNGDSRRIAFNIWNFRVEER